MAAVITNPIVSAVTGTGFTLTLTSDTADEDIWAACRTSGPYGAGDAEQIKTDSQAAPTAGIPWGGTITSTADSNNTFTVTGLQTSQTVYYGVAQEGEVVVTNLHINPNLSGGDAVSVPPTGCTWTFASTSEWPTPTDTGGGNFEWETNISEAECRVYLDYPIGTNNPDLPLGVYEVTWDVENMRGAASPAYGITVSNPTNINHYYHAGFGVAANGKRRHGSRFQVTGSNATGTLRLGMSLSANSVSRGKLSNPSITFVDDPMSFPNPLFEGQHAGNVYPTYWYSAGGAFDHVVVDGVMTVNAGKVSNRYHLNFSVREFPTLEVGKTYRIYVEAMRDTVALGTWDNINMAGTGLTNFSVARSIDAEAGEWGELYAEFGITTLSHSVVFQLGPGTGANSVATFAYRNPRIVEMP